MQELSRLNEEVDRWEDMRQRVLDGLDLAELLVTETDEALIGELSADVEKLEKSLEREEFLLLFSDEHAAKDAILAIHAGAGGTESQDWAEMLLRMYLRWAEQRGFDTSILSRTEGEEAGIKSVTVEVKGRYAYGNLKAERGVHRLVRLSPYDSAHRRHTSFALVEALPDIGDEIDIQVSPDDLRMDYYRASGHGGQNVQKNDTAVRLTHLPTGIVVTCQNERSQVQNRETAMKILRARLYELELIRQEEEKAKLKGEHVEAGWGNQIRSYVLHPYNMVKDHRTGHETGNTGAVLDGDLDPFIESYLRSQVGVE